MTKELIYIASANFAHLRRKRFNAAAASSAAQLMASDRTNLVKGAVICINCASAQEICVPSVKTWRNAHISGTLSDRKMALSSGQKIKG